MTKPCIETDGSVEDIADLSAWITSRDSIAFDRLVERHIGLILGVSQRILGTGQAADDAVQASFLLLARKARSIRNPGALPAWLHRTAVMACRQVQRGERLRRRREEQAMAEAATVIRPPEDDEWEAVRPHLDEALASLPTAKRDVMVRHYLHGESLTVLAKALGITSDAARMRRNEGLVMLRRWFGRRGVQVGALTTILAERSLTAEVPSALVEMCTGAGATAGPAALGLAKGISTTMFIKKIGTAACAAVCAFLVLSIGWRLVAAEPTEPPAVEHPDLVGVGGDFAILAHLEEIQQDDGSWRDTDQAGKSEPQRTTALALLTFFSAGYHDGSDSSRYQATIAKAWQWLVDQPLDGIGIDTLTIRALVAAERQALTNAGHEEVRRVLVALQQRWPTDGLASSDDPAAERDQAQNHSVREVLWVAMAWKSARVAGVRDPDAGNSLADLRTWFLRIANQAATAVDAFPADAIDDAVVLGFFLGLKSDEKPMKELIDLSGEAVAGPLDPEHRWLTTMAAFLIGGKTWQSVDTHAIRQELLRQMVAEAERGRVSHLAALGLTASVHERAANRSPTSSEQPTQQEKSHPPVDSELMYNF